MDTATLAACTEARFDRAERFAFPLTAAMDRFEINTPSRVACFLATVAIESARLIALEENLTYSSADRLRQIFPSLFEPTKGGNHRAENYVRNPGGLSRLRYEGFHGRGLIQLTWLENYVAAGNALGFDYASMPELVLQPAHAAMTAAWFFAVHAKCIPMADRGDMHSITGAVNGPARLNLVERKALMVKAIEVLT